MKRVVLMCAALSAAATGGLTGCSNAASNPDGGAADMKKPVVPPPLYLGKTPDGGVAANYTNCPPDPAPPDEDTMVTGTILDFQDDNPVAGATVEVYYNTTEALNHMPRATSSKSDNDGNFTITLPKGFPFRIIRRNSGGEAISSGNRVPTIATIEFNQKWNDTKPTAVKLSTKQAIPGLVSVTQMDGLGVLAGSVRDCDNQEVGGALVTATVQGNPYSSDGLMFYFVDVSGSTLPTRVQKWTSGANGSFAALNVPPGVGNLLAQGIFKAGDPLATISMVSVPVIADEITIIELPPIKQP